MKLRRAVLRGGRAFFHATTAHHSRFLRLDRFFLRFLAPPLPPSRSFLPSLLAFPRTRVFLRWPKFKVSARRHLISVDLLERASNDKKTHEDKRQKTKRQRGFPACSQASTNAPQAGLSSLFRWGRLIFCWYERLMEVSARRVSITVMTCIGRDTLMGHFCTCTRERAHRMRA